MRSPRDDGLVIELDVYTGDLDGLVTAEVEFASEEAAEAFARARLAGPRRHRGPALQEPAPRARRRTVGAASAQPASEPAYSNQSKATVPSAAYRPMTRPVNPPATSVDR